MTRAWDIYIAGEFAKRIYYYGYVQQLLAESDDILIHERLLSPWRALLGWRRGLDNQIEPLIEEDEQ